MVMVQQVKDATGGFGEFQVGEAVEQPEFQTVENFLANAFENGYSQDEETEAAAEDADGKTRGQCGGRIVGLRNTDGEIDLYCVYVN